MNKRIFVAVIAVCLLLSGCQLAQPDAQEEKDKDRMVGVFITTEYLDLFDMEAYLKDHSNLLSGGTIDRSEDSAYNGRIYAKYIEETNEVGTNVRYVFEDLEGILTASYLVKPHGGNLEAYWMSAVTEGICDVSIAHHARDDGEDHSISGTIYLSPEYIDPCFYFNPVYQTEDGDVYLMAGQGLSFETGFAGSSCHTLNETATYTENGTTRSYTAESKITLECAVPAKVVIVLHMDENNNILSRNEYTADELPETLTPEAGTAYLLVEEHTAQTIRRSLYQPGDDSISVFKALENQICVKSQIVVQWPE